MKKKNREFIKNMILFAISNLVPKILSFIMIPIYTKYLTTNDYGYSDLIISTAAFLLPIFTLNLQDAVMKYSLDNSNYKKDIFTIASKIYFIGILLVALLSIIASMLNIINLPSYFIVYLIIYYTVSAIHSLFTYFCKGIGKINIIIYASLANSLIVVVMNIFLVIILKMGAIGYLLANILGLLISIIIMFIFAKLYLYWTKEKNRKLAKEMIKFSIPMILSAIGWWINNSIDKYFLSLMVSVSVMGIYSIASKIPNMLAIFQSIFNSAWSISAIKEYDPDDKDGFFSNTLILINMFSTISASILMITNLLISKILFSGEFFDAWKYVPPLLMSVIFNITSLFFESILLSTNNTKEIGKSSIMGAATNIILDFILIKFIGAYGASIATMISFFIVLLFKCFKAQKYIKFKEKISIVFISYLLLFIQTILAYFGNKFILLELLILLTLLYLYKNKILVFLKKIKLKYLIKN